MRTTRRTFVAGASAVGLVAALGEGMRGQAGGKAAAAGTIREAAAGKGLLAGCAVPVGRLRDDPAYAALVKAQAGIVVAENEFKFAHLRPTPDSFFFEDADLLAAFAEKNGMKLRGHNFVWHRSLPPWFAGYVTPKNAEQVLVGHIERVAGRYAGRIHSWDVVNEAVEVKDGLRGGMRDSPWEKLLPGEGPVPGYLEIAYRTARRVDPKALLVYNDYGIEGEDAGSAAKRAAVLGLLRSMLTRGIPLDALGIQSHITAGHTYGAGLTSLMTEARGMGLKLLLTEMDVNDRGLAAPIPARDAAVAGAYAGYLKTALADPAVIAVLTWGITDKYTWLNSDQSRADKAPERCLPFDAELQPTPAFAAMVQALGNAPGRG